MVSVMPILKNISYMLKKTNIAKIEHDIMMQSSVYKQSSNPVNGNNHVANAIRTKRNLLLEQ